MISIITIALNQRAYTEMLLKSLSQPQCADMPFELVFIDNGSTDGSAEMVKQYPLNNNPNFMHLTYYRFTSNQGVAAAINKGVELARREIILQADNDIVFGPESLSVLLKFYRTHPKAMVSPNWPWVQKKLGINFIKNSSELTGTKLKKLRRLGMNAPLEPYRATGSCWMCSKTLFEQVGGWDSTYKNICASDDFLMKIAISGAQRYTIPCPIYHPGKITRSKIPNNHEQQQKDLQRFIQKWGGHPEDKELFRNQQLLAGVMVDPPINRTFWKKLMPRFLSK